MLKVTINPEIETDHYRFVRNALGEWTQFVKQDFTPMAITNPGHRELLNAIVESGNQAQS